MKKRKTMKIVYRDSINSGNYPIYDSMPNSHIWTFNIINKYGTDYFIFLLGFTSSLFIQEIYIILSNPVKTDPTMFAFSLINASLLLIICSIGIRFVILMQETQDLFAGKNNAGKVNYYLEYYDEYFKDYIQRINARCSLIIAFVLVMLFINIIKFLYINGLSDLILKAGIQGLKKLFN